MKSGLSVVMATLGGNLTSELESLNASTLKPDEIIISLPNKKHKLIDENKDKNKNVRILYANTYGQVAQRIFGFKYVEYDHVLQIDDGVFFEPSCIGEMMTTMSLKEGLVAVAPYWKNIEDCESFCSGKKEGFLMETYYWLLNGKKKFVAGAISMAGTEFCVNHKDVSTSSNIVEVAWQPGGGILQKTDNLVLDNYYPWQGKAFSEDLFHSYMLRQREITLYVNLNAFAYCNIHPGITKISDLWQSFKVRWAYVKMAKLSKIRLIIYVLIYLIKPILKKTFNFG